MTNSWLTVHPVFPIWVIVLLTLPVFTFFIWKEIKRPHKFLFVRILAMVLVLISVLGLLIAPSLRKPKSGPSIILLTPGFDKAKVDSVVHANSSAKIIRTSDIAPYPNSEALASIYTLTDIGEDITVITGEGLPAYALDLMNQKNFKFIPAAPPKGVVQVYFPKPVVVNKTNSVKGIFNAFGKTTLTLSGPAGVEDSVTFNTSGEFPFELFFKPKQSGLFAYEIRFHDGTSAIREKLPVEVTMEQKLKILILQKFPTAEIRYLKNYLVEKGHQLALRYQTSRTNFKYEYANLNSVKIDRLSPEVAESFDLIFIDDKVLIELNAAEKSALEGAIQNGLGVIILSDEFSEKDKVVNRLLPIKTKKLSVDTVHARFGHSKLYTIPFVPIEITADASIQPILQHNGQMLSGYRFHGAGKVGFQLLKETYRISLEGNENDYTFIWSDLVERTARSANDPFKINFVNSFPYYPDEPLTIDIISSGGQPTLYENLTVIPLAEDVIIDNYWHGKSWAGKPGWHRFHTQDSTQLNYFVSNQEEWKSLRITNQIKLNELASGESQTSTSPQFTHEPIAPLVFFLIFLLASGFLWLAPKI